MNKSPKNTKKSGILHFRIFKWNGRYLGICKETGFVEESKDFGVVKNKLINGSIALIEAVRESSQNLEPSLNTRPPFKYLMYYYASPLLSWIELGKDSTKLESGGFHAFAEPIESYA
jgi:hypothetical protein